MESNQSNQSPSDDASSIGNDPTDEMASSPEESPSNPPYEEVEVTVEQPEIPEMTLKTESSPSNSLNKLEPEEIPYNQKKAQEDTRAFLARALIGLLCGTVLSSFIVILFLDLEKQSSKKELITIILTSQGALIGTALGFYFGSPNQN